jgi:hypothetical protein
MVGVGWGGGIVTNSVVLVVPNVKVRMEAQHSNPPPTLHDVTRKLYVLSDCDYRCTVCLTCSLNYKLSSSTPC